MDVGPDHRGRAAPAAAHPVSRRRHDNHPREADAAAPVAREHALGYPSGWFALALTRELAPGAVLRRRLVGEDVVVYHTRKGTAYAVRPHCPHLGAHLGYGATVAGEDLACPFHQFAYAPDGSCTGAPDGAVIRGRLHHHAVAERDGFVFVWHGGDHAADVEPPQAL